MADRPAPGPDLPPDGDDRHSPAPSWLLQVVAELLRTRRVAQLAQRLGLDLADALAGDAEALAHLFERPLVAVDQPETQLQDAPLSRRERVEDVFDLRVEHRERRGVRRRDALPALHHVAH